MVTTASASPPLYAGFWRRGAAWAVDVLITSVANAAAGVSLGPDVGAAILSLAMDCGYVALFHSSAKQATPGKMLFGIKVTDLDGERIGLLRATARYFAAWLSMLILLLGFVMAAFTTRKQALHDIVAGTLVVRRDAEPEEIVRGGATMRLTAGVVIVAALSALLPAAAATFFFAMGGPARYADSSTRAKVGHAVAFGGTLKTEVAEAIAAKRPVKSGPADTSSAARYVREATVEANGEITLRLVPALAKGGTIVFTPALDAAGTVASWTCRSPDIPDKWLPASCRR